MSVREPLRLPEPQLDSGEPPSSRPTADGRRRAFPGGSFRVSLPCRPSPGSRPVGITGGAEAEVFALKTLAVWRGNQNTPNQQLYDPDPKSHRYLGAGGGERSSKCRVGRGVQGGGGASLHEEALPERILSRVLHLELCKVWCRVLSPNRCRVRWQGEASSLGLPPACTLGSAASPVRGRGTQDWACVIHMALLQWLPDWTWKPSISRQAGRPECIRACFLVGIQCIFLNVKPGQPRLKLLPTLKMPDIVDISSTCKV